MTSSGWKYDCSFQATIQGVSTCRDDVNANKGDQSLVRKPIFDRLTVDKCLKIVYVVYVVTIR